jgi:Ras-related protein Rab-38
LGVGKTSLIKRFIEDNFTTQYIPTKGVEFYVKKVELEKKKIVMKFWDISGDSLTNNMIETYLHHSKAVH